MLVTDDRTELTASLTPDEARDWQRAVDIVTAQDAPAVVALTGRSSYSTEYLWWKSLGQASAPDLIHIEVMNPTARYERQVTPDVVIARGAPPDEPNDRAGYVRHDAGIFTVFVRE